MTKPLVLLFLIPLAFLGQACGQSPTPSPTPIPLDGLLLRPDLWNVTPQDLQKEFKPLRMAWTSAAMDTARSSGPGLQLGSRAANEVLLRFHDGRLSEVTLFYFNRGDAGDLLESEFEKLLAAITQDLSTLTGKPPVERGRDTTSAVKAEGRIWDAGAVEYLLEWSVTKGSRVKGIPFRAESIRLTLRPPNTAPAAIGAATPSNSARSAVKQFVGRDHIEGRAGSSVKIKDVPMVDQGEKGYCVVASVERVMRYYGAEVDQHELAQMADSDAAKGTSPSALLDSLKKLTARLGVRTKAVIDWDYREFLKTLSDYNRATKRGKLAPEITGNYQTLDDYYERMNPQIYREVRLKQKADLGKFQREIQRSIDEGIPLLWSVRIGLVKEKGIPQQTSGGHMRLIIGYDTTSNEVIYSDSWGRGHEEKRMPVEDAWTITTLLSTIQPLSS